MCLVFFLDPIQVSVPVCVCTFLCVYYHLHWVCEHHTIEANEVLVVQGVHGVDFTDEVLQSVRLTENICLQTLHSNIQLETKTKIQYTESRGCFWISSTCCVGLSLADIWVLLMLDIFKMHVSPPSSLKVSTTLLFSLHRTIHPPASQTMSDPSLG